MRSRTAFPAAGLLLLVLAATALAQKTDVIVLINGDRITGEIKSYSAGRLVVDTDGAGDVSIKWNKIASITSDKEFEIETHGRRLSLRDARAVHAPGQARHRVRGR